MFKKTIETKEYLKIELIVYEKYNEIILTDIRNTTQLPKEKQKNPNDVLGKTSSEARIMTEYEMVGFKMV